MGSGPQTIAQTGGTNEGYHDLVLSGSGTKTLPASIVNITGDFRNNSTLAHGSGTINFNGTSAQIINGSSNSNFNNLTLNNTTGLTLGANSTVNGTLTLTSGKLAIGAYTLTLDGAFSGSGTNSLKGSASSNLECSGTTGNVYFDQDTPGTTNVLKNLTINGNTTTLANALNITAGATPGLVTINSGTLASGGNLTLKSNASGTASIGTSAGSITGDVNVERYVSAAGRRWRFLSSPVTSATVANWMTQFYVTGPGDGTTLGTALPTTGWHTCQANIDFPNSTYGSDPRSVKTTSIRTYNETVSGNNTNLNAGWENLTSTSQALTPGQGFRTYIRGQIGTTGQLDGTVTSQTDVTLALTGPVNQGNVTPTLTNSTQGWNFLGNPYACGYDFNAQYDAGLGIANIDPSVYVYNATSNSYVSYNASSNTPSGLTSGVIPSGAGFFVQAIGSPTFQFREAYKNTAVNPTVVHKTDISIVDFGIKYYKDSTESDYMVVKMFDGATMNNEIFDTKKVNNENLNLSAYGTDSVLLTASCIPFITEETHIKLNVEATQIATYNFDFKNMNNFDAGVSVSLFDRYTNTTTDVRKNTKYTFEMGPGTNQWGKNRFELILNGKATTGVNENKNNVAATQLLVYPNPATDVLNISISNISFKNSNLSIYDVTGKQIMTTNMSDNTAQINIDGLKNGVYFLNINNKNGYDKTVKFVK